LLCCRFIKFVGGGCAQCNAQPTKGEIDDRLMRPLTILTLLVICIAANCQLPARSWVDTEVKYTDSVGRVVMVHNSLPKGGGEYTDSAGKKYSYVIFWNRVMNESASPLELMIKFPAEPFTIFPSPDSHIKIFLPPDAMTADKIQLGDYGLNLQSFLDVGFNKSSLLQKTINPKEECLFYVAVIIYHARGTARAGLVLKEQNLFYRISIDPQSALIPCGQIVFKN
jgi:hypothetical protein